MKSKTPEATDAFRRVQEEMKRFGSPSPQNGVPGVHREKLFDPSIALESASKRDENSMRTLSRVKPILSAPSPSEPTKNVNFFILESPHELREDQLIIIQKIDNSTTIAGIIWRFSRYPEIVEKTTLRQNPHFYHQLSNDAASFGSRFHKDPLRDFAHLQRDSVYVLSDKSCRLFLDTTKPRIFGNLWKPHQTIILKDVSGILESEDIVLRNIGESQDYWYRPSRVADPSQRRVGLGHSGANSDSYIVNTPVGNGRALIDLALRSQDVDLMIRDRSRPLPPADSGWRPLPSPESISRLGSRVQEPEGQTTPTQSTTHLPQPEPDYFPNSSASSIGDSALFSSSTESDEIDFLPVLGAAGDCTQLVDNGIGLQSELSTADTADTPSQSPSSAPPADLTAMLRLRHLHPNHSNPSISGSSLTLIPNRLLETSVNVSEPPNPSLSMRTALGSIDLQAELPTADTLSTPPPSPPPISLTIPSPLPEQDRELLSAPPVREWEAHGNWFQKYKYDYDSES
ncbi:hypothetical protein BJY52DRAFT_253247 [Lactarius psammicola]|nr:hypothetical protein BJY52DRAFT_253247 [Lactarius psammicola]